MDFVIVFAAGIILGAGLAFGILQGSQRQRTTQALRQEIQLLQQSHQAELSQLIQAQEGKITALEHQHQEAVESAKRKSVDSSRSVIKGQIAEQLAPYLPNFNYLPSDARFIGDPIDYLVVNGYTNLKDGQGSADELEVVLIDIKSGKAKLSARQEAIQKTVELGRVRFETIRINVDDLAAVTLPNLPTALPEPLAPIAEMGDLDMPEPLPEVLPPLPSSSPRPSTFQRSQKIAKAREQFPRAYEPWDQKEDFKLGALFQQGYSLDELATELQRQPSAIKSRLLKLNIIPPEHP